MKNKKLLITALVFASLLTLFVTTFAISNSKDRVSVDRPPNTVDYSDPTDEEVAAGDAQKELNEQREAIDKKTASKNNIAAELAIVDFSQYGEVVELRSFITNVYEDGGTCTATLTQDNLTITKISKAFKDATTTQCSIIEIPRSEFKSSGTWLLSLEYKSGTASGTVKSKIEIK